MRKIEGKFSRSIALIIVGLAIITIVAILGRVLMSIDRVSNKAEEDILAVGESENVRNNVEVGVRKEVGGSSKEKDVIHSYYEERRGEIEVDSNSLTFEKEVDQETLNVTSIKVMANTKKGEGEMFIRGVLVGTILGSQVELNISAEAAKKLSKLQVPFGILVDVGKCKVGDKYVYDLRIVD